MYVNEVVVLGNLCREVNTYATNSGKQLSDFSIAVNKMVNDKQKTIFLKVKAWGKTGQYCQQNLAKGDCVLVIGELEMDSWEDKKTGQKKTQIYVSASKVWIPPKGRAREEDGYGNMAEQYSPYGGSSVPQPPQYGGGNGNDFDAF